MKIIHHSHIKLQYEIFFRCSGTNRETAQALSCSKFIQGLFLPNRDKFLQQFFCSFFFAKILSRFYPLAHPALIYKVKRSSILRNIFPKKGFQTKSLIFATVF